MQHARLAAGLGAGLQEGAWAAGHGRVRAGLGSQLPEPGGAARATNRAGQSHPQLPGHGGRAGHAALPTLRLRGLHRSRPSCTLLPTWLGRIPTPAYATSPGMTLKIK